MNAAVSRSYNGWEPLFSEEFSKDYFKGIKAFLEREYAQKTVYPPKKLILNAFDLTAPQDVKVVILGQDPYINPGQAMGACFQCALSRAASAELAQYFQGNQGRDGQGLRGKGRRPHRLGKAGGAFAQHLPHGGERREQFPQQHRVADFYRQSNFLDKRQRRKTRRIYALGRQRAQEKKPAYQYFAFGAGSGASESAFRLQRIFRLRSFRKSQRIFKRLHHADRVVKFELQRARKTRPFFVCDIKA